MKEKCFFIFVSCAMILAIFAGCSASSDGSDDSGQNQWNPYDKYYQISLKESGQTIMLNVGDTYQLSVEINSKTDDDIALVWNSGDDRIASVSKSGLISAKSFGGTWVYFSLENGWEGWDNNSCYIRVNDPNMLTRENAAEILGKDYRYKTTIVIPEGITGIGDAFAWDDGIYAENIIISNTVTYISERAFVGCGWINSIVIPSSVTSIGCGAFEGCENIKDVYIDNLESYEQIEFGNEWNSDYSRPDCYGATLHIGEIFEIPPEEDIIILTKDNVYRILTDDYYSYGYVEIPETVKEIGDYVFEYFSSLQSVAIPSSVTSIGRNAFYYCTGLKDVNIESLESWLGINFGNCYGNPLSYAKHLFVNGEEVTHLVIPDGTKKINDNAFYNYESLQSVTIPSDIVSIGDYAFYDCPNLQSITISDGLTSISIAHSAFAACDNLNAVNIESVEGWLEINFGNYYDNPLYYAKHLYLNGEEVTNLVIPDGITKINDYAFYNYESLQSVTIPSSLTSIGDNAFYECNNIKTVYVDTHETWRNLNIGYNNCLYNAKIIFRDDGEVNITVKFPDAEKEDVPNLECTKNGNVVTISAEIGHLSYAWFVDMQKQSTAGRTLEFDTTNKKAGLYSVMVVIDGKFSATATIEVLK